MPVAEVTKTGHITLHYYLVGNANTPAHSAYRSDNPWQKMTTLRDELRSAASAAATSVGAVLFSAPDDSVWRLELTGAVTPVTLEHAAKQLLDLVDARLKLAQGDDIRAVVADSTGVMREWQLTP